MRESSLVRIGSVFRALQLHRLRGMLSAGRNVRITCTHHVFAEDLENFENLVKYAAGIRKVITPQDFFDSYQKKYFPEDSLLFTFDDGLLSSYRAAKEVLSKYNIKAIFFVPTAVLDFKTEDQMRRFSVSRVYFDRRNPEAFRKEEYITMGREYLLDLSKQGHVILPHTHSHCLLKDIRDEAAVQKEIKQPKELLEDLLKRKIDAMAFPVGTERVVSAYAYSRIKELYQCCFTGLGGVNPAGTDQHFIYRDCLHAHFSIKHARNILEGVYDAYYSYKMFRLKKIAGEGRHK